MTSTRSLASVLVFMTAASVARTADAQLLPPFPEFPNYSLCNGAAGDEYILNPAQVEAVVQPGGYFDQARDRIYALTPGELADLDPYLTGPNGPVTQIRNSDPSGYDYVPAELSNAMAVCATDPIYITLYSGDLFNFYCSNYSSDVNDLGGRYLIYQTMILVFGDPSFAVSLQSPSVCPSAAAVFSIVALPNGPSSFEYHWQFRRRPEPDEIGSWQDIENGENVLGMEFMFNAADADTSNMTIDRSSVPQGSGEQVGWSTVASPPLQFRCRIVNYCGSALSSIATLTVCAADFDCNGAHEVPDIFTFLTAWFANDPAAYEFGGTPGVPAIFAFLTAWFDGCP